MNGPGNQGPCAKGSGALHRRAITFHNKVLYNEIVTDCYRIRVDPPRTVEDAPAGQRTYRFTPCRDADVLIRGDELSVNGRSYGHLDVNDAVVVDHGVVSIHRVRLETR